MASKKQISYDQINSVSVKGGINSRSGEDEHSFNYTLEAVGSKQSITLATGITNNRDKDFLQKHFEHEFFGEDAELVFD